MADLGDYIARMTRPLPPLAQLGSAPETLAALREIVGTSRIVSLGESFHHTHEFLALRAGLTRILVSELGFDTVLLEVVTPGPNPIDAFVQDGENDAERGLILAGARMWRNRETAGLVDWLRQRNLQGGGRPVSVRGMDVIAVGAPMRRVLDALEAPDEASARARELSRSFDIDGRVDQVAYNQMDEADREILRSVFQKAFIDLSTHATDLGQALGEEAYVSLTDDALVVLQTLAMMQIGTQGWQAGFGARDAAMAESVARLVDRGDRASRIVILSHNAHIAATPQSREPGALAHQPMGAHLRRRYGSDYCAIGTTFGRTRFDPLIYGVGAFETQDKDTIDYSMAQLGLPVAVVDLRKAQPDAPLRLNGVGSGQIVYPSLSTFDALVYLDTLTNAQQLVETELTMDIAAIDATRAAPAFD